LMYEQMHHWQQDPLHTNTAVSRCMHTVGCNKTCAAQGRESVTLAVVCLALLTARARRPLGRARCEAATQVDGESGSPTAPSSCVTLVAASRSESARGEVLVQNVDGKPCRRATCACECGSGTGGWGREDVCRGTMHVNCSTVRGCRASSRRTHAHTSYHTTARTHVPRYTAHPHEQVSAACDPRPRCGRRHFFPFPRTLHTHARTHTVPHRSVALESLSIPTRFHPPTSGSAKLNLSVSTTPSRWTRRTSVDLTYFLARRAKKCMCLTHTAQVSLRVCTLPRRR